MNYGLWLIDLNKLKVEVYMHIFGHLWNTRTQKYLKYAQCSVVQVVSGVWFMCNWAQQPPSQEQFYITIIFLLYYFQPIVFLSFCECEFLDLNPFWREQLKFLA